MAATSGPPFGSGQAVPTRGHRCAHSADAKTEHPTRRGGRGFLEPRTGKLPEEDGEASPLGRGPSGEGGRGGGRSPPFAPPRGVDHPPTQGEHGAAQPSGPRVPSDEAPMVRPAGPRGQWFAPPPRAPLRRGLTATVAGLGDAGLSPALPELQARRHLVAVPGFRSGKCESG